MKEAVPVSPIKKILRTEKTQFLKDRKTFCFVVRDSFNKIFLKKTLSTMFNVEISSIRVLNTPSYVRKFRGKVGSVSGVKKVYITLSSGDIALENSIQE